MTLVELCIASALVALLAGLAAPGLRTSLRTTAVRTATYELLAGVQQLRAHSILEARAGALCLSRGDGVCLRAPASGSAWESYLEFPAGPSPLAGGSLPRGIVIHANRSPLRFWPHAPAATTGTLTICDAQGIASPRAIVISQSGRARLTDAPASECRG